MTSGNNDGSEERFEGIDLPTEAFATFEEDGSTAAKPQPDESYTNVSNEVDDSQGLFKKKEELSTEHVWQSRREDDSSHSSGLVEIEIEGIDEEALAKAFKAVEGQAKAALLASETVSGKNKATIGHSNSGNEKALELERQLRAKMEDEIQKALQKIKAGDHIEAQSISLAFIPSKENQSKRDDATFQESAKNIHEAKHMERQEAELRERQEAELRERQEAELRERQEAERRERQEAELRERQETELRERQETELRERQETELRERQEAEIIAKAKERAKQLSAELANKKAQAKAAAEAAAIKKAAEELLNKASLALEASQSKDIVRLKQAWPVDAPWPEGLDWSLPARCAFDHFEEGLLHCINIGMDIGKTDSGGLGPMHWALSRKAVRCLLILIENNAPWPDLPKPFAMAALEKLGAAKAEGPLRAAFSRGLDPNEKDSSGRSIAHAAAEAGAVEILAMLIEKRAALGTPDNHGNTPLTLAKSKKHSDFCIVLQAHLAAKKR